MLVSPVNVSEGRDQTALVELVQVVGRDLLDIHTDPDHNRSVLTAVGTAAVRRLSTRAVELLDLRDHEGVHPRFGVVDVVPFVPLGGSSMADAIDARDEFARWLSETHGVPTFVYGPDRSLPEIRRGAFAEIAPDHGPGHPHVRAGATAVGARAHLIAYNVWLSGGDLSLARRVAREIRGPAVRALGLEVGGRAQVSMNLIDPDDVGPDSAYDLVAARAGEAGTGVEGAELVGLIGEATLKRIPRQRWESLDLAPDRTFESRLRRAHPERPPE